MTASKTDPIEFAIQIEGLTCHYGKRSVLSDVTLAVPAGCALAVIGKPGSGKTTLHNCVVGRLAPETGTVRVWGKDPTVDQEFVLSQIGYLPEEDDLPRWMRVQDLFKYQQRIQTHWDKDLATQLERELEVKQSAVYGELSQGERARVRLFIALTCRPRLLVIDDAISRHDRIVRKMLGDAIKEVIDIEGDKKRTVLFTSHSAEEVKSLADQMVVLEQGRVVFSDSVVESWEVCKEKLSMLG